MSGVTPPPGITPAPVCMGRPAHRALMAGHGSVLAAFRSAVYIEGRTGIACLVPPSVPRGPLNVVLPAFIPGTPQLHGAAWRMDGTDLVVDGVGRFAISPREEWNSARLEPASVRALPVGLASMLTALAARAPRGEVLSHALGPPFERFRVEDSCAVSEGTSREPAWSRRPSPSLFPRERESSADSEPQEVPCGHSSLRLSGTPPAPGAMVTHFARTVPALSRWLDEMLSGCETPSPTPVADLLGAGSGLTPAGDDCIVGVLVALHAFGAQRVADAIARIVARHARLRTTRLSAAHLDAACSGEAIEPVHEAIDAIAAAVSAEPALDALERYGHGSGFDALAGVLLAACAIAHNWTCVPCADRHSAVHMTRTRANR